jgi:uncharacterized protein (DUF433 family)/DNA-binding transcriptional MerR regulator
VGRTEGGVTATTKAEATPELGAGLYTFSEAARILRRVNYDVTSRQLRYWIAEGLVRSTPIRWGDGDGTESVLTFDDLIGLEIIRRFRSEGASLQRVRQFDHALRQHYPDLENPFVYRIFFTDGANIWASVDDDHTAVIELVGKRPGQYVWPEAIKTFAKEIRWSEGQPAKAIGWRLSPWVEIDPDVQFGAPVVTGTRVPVRTIVANLAAGTPEDVADWYGLDVEAVLGAQEYVALS